MSFYRMKLFNDEITHMSIFKIEVNEFKITADHANTHTTCNRKYLCSISSMFVPYKMFER